MKAPWPYYGGKARVARDVWARLGDVDHYIEPFAGGAAVLLGRPPTHSARAETLNDADGLLVNAWRAITYAPRELARMVEMLPVSELDLHARNRALIDAREDLTEQLLDDPQAHDLEAAAWWVWGQSTWTGGEWAAKDYRRRPVLNRVGRGVKAEGVRDRLMEMFAGLALRLRHVRILCGSWERVLTEDVLSCGGAGASVGILLDPPYDRRTGRIVYLYAQEMTNTDPVRERAAELGQDLRHRIALCGLVGEHADLEARGWVAETWREKGECIWYSPGCFGPAQADMWGGS